MAVGDPASAGDGFGSQLAKKRLQFLESEYVIQKKS